MGYVFIVWQQNETRGRDQVLKDVNKMLSLSRISLISF